jgi:deoxyribodipyrimidine photo-lyase
MSQLVWFRDDLRTHDNRALTNAINKATEQNTQCLAIYYWSEQQLRSHGSGNNKLSAMQTALAGLNMSLARIGVPLTVVNIDSWSDIATHIASFCDKHNVNDLHFHSQPAFNEEKRDKAVSGALAEKVKVSTYNDLNLIDPHEHTNLQGDYFKVFTAYKKSVLRRLESASVDSVAAPKFRQPIAAKPIKFETQYTWQNPLQLAITEEEAFERFEAFLADEKAYDQSRDIPSIRGTSRLSVALALGTITSRQILHELLLHGRSAAQSTYFSEIIWRDYYKYLLIHRPELSYGKAFNEKWDRFPWSSNESKFENWKSGNTGVPIVDAGMRQLNQTGWMHNRLRMITAMYLTKILQIDWRLGERYFAEKLADFDFAANNGGWQWVASTGVDATPYFRIFNPYLQSKKFDPQGRFIRKYVPELATLEPSQMHEPSALDCSLANYVQPVVDYKTAREDTLIKFKSIKEFA